MRTPIRLAALALVLPPASVLAQARLRAALAAADSMVSSAVSDNLTPGAVLVVSVGGHVVHEKAFGYAQLYDFQMHRLANPQPMHASTMFDLASVTKVMATTFGIMMLVDRGKLDLDAPVYHFLPDFRGPHLDSVRLRHLLTHTAGLVQWQPLYYHASNKEQTYDVIRSMPLKWGVGEGYHYSDLGFMLLGYIVERASGQPLDVFLADNLYTPLGVRRTAFNPKARGFTDFAATEAGNAYERHMVYGPNFGYGYPGDPTSWNGWRQYVLVGETDDGNSFYANGGVAGHAGLFSTGADLSVLLDLLLNRGSYGGRQYVRPQVVDLFLAPGHHLGWKQPSDLPADSFSHDGFTGTFVVGVPEGKLGIVLLTNKQNLGTNAKGLFTNVAPLDQAVTKVLSDAVLR